MILVHISPKYLPDKTNEVINVFAGSKFIKNYTMVGGTALALQIQHRLSNDLDFILDDEFLNNTSIKRNINSLFANYKIIKEDDSYQIDFVINDVKVTFFSAGSVIIPFKVMDYSFNYKNLNIADAEIIGIIKLIAITQRNTIRDYYDLYYLSKHKVSLNQIIERAKKLVPNLSPVTYSETLIYTDDLPEVSLSEHLKPKEVITKKQLAEFFVGELKNITKKE